MIPHIIVVMAIRKKVSEALGESSNFGLWLCNMPLFQGFQ